MTQDTTPQDVPADEPVTKDEDPLAKVKGHLNKAYGERDAERARADALAAELTKIKADRLAAEGKAVEAAEMRAKDAAERAEKLAQENAVLTRDNKIESALTGLQFASKAARAAATRELASSLVKTPEGWTANGKDVATFVAEWVADPDNQYLFVQKRNSGGGSAPGVPAGGPANQPVKLMGLTNAEVMRLAREGLLPKKT